MFSHYLNMDVKEKIFLANAATITVLDRIHTKGMTASNDANELKEETRQKMLEVFIKTSS